MRWGGAYSNEGSNFLWVVRTSPYCLINADDVWAEQETELTSWDPSIRTDLNAMHYYPTDVTSWMTRNNLDSGNYMDAGTNFEIKRSIDVMPCVVSTSQLTTSCSYGSSNEFFCAKGGYYQSSNICTKYECVVPYTFANGNMSSGCTLGERM